MHVYVVVDNYEVDEDREDKAASLTNSQSFGPVTLGPFESTKNINPDKLLTEIGKLKWDFGEIDVE
jgi:hypothetical protein